MDDILIRVGKVELHNSPFNRKVPNLWSIIDGAAGNLPGTRHGGVLMAKKKKIVVFPGLILDWRYRQFGLFASGLRLLHH